MPTYDFVCRNCGKPFDIFVPISEYGKRKVVCAHCGSENVRRRMTRVRLVKSEDSRLDNLADDAALEGLENDPRALGQMMKKMGREMGEDLPPEFDDMADRLQSGQSPEEIEAALPDLPGGSDPGDGLDDDL